MYLKACLCITLLMVSFSAEGAPRRFVMRSDKASNAIEELHNAIDDVKYEASNQEAEMRMFEEKLTNQEMAIDSLWKQLNDSNSTQREKMRDGLKSVEVKISSLESNTSGAKSDIESLKHHANDSSNLLSQHKQKIVHLEKIVEIQNQNIEHLEAALKALMDALQIKDVALETENPFNNVASGVIYQVKAGDSLEKIARKNHTTVHKLKELNNLTGNNDLIIVGQKLKLPE